MIDPQQGPQPFVAIARDGFQVHGFEWRHGDASGTSGDAPDVVVDTARPSGEAVAVWSRGSATVANEAARRPDESRARAVVLICAATSVQCRYYFRFAQYLFELGLDVVTFDYRGIGVSRTQPMRGFDASWFDWGALDCDAVLSYLVRDYPGQPIDVVAHSFGGCTVGLSENGYRVRRMVTVGAQFAYWRDYQPAQRLGMLMKWHVVMPVLTLLCGYFPGRRLGWLEDTPAGVVRDWIAPASRIADLPSVRRSGVDVGQRFASVRASVLAISLTDDPYGTTAAIARLLSLHSSARCKHLRIAPKDIGADAVGHFAFFHARHTDDLWPYVRDWLLEDQ